MDDLRKWLDIVQSGTEKENQIDEDLGSWWQGRKDKRKRKKANKSRFKANRKLGSERVVKIDRLANIIQDLELEDEVIEFINMNTSIFSKESYEQSGELLEKIIDDKGIKQVLMQIVRQGAGEPSSPMVDPSDDKKRARETTERFFDKWKKTLDNAVNGVRDLKKGQKLKADGEEYTWQGGLWTKLSPNGKDVPVSPKRGDPSNKELTNLHMRRTGQTTDVDEVVAEMVNFLADRQGTFEWKSIVKRVKSVLSSYIGGDKAQTYIDAIDRGKTLESILYYAFTDILHECNVKWFDIGWKPIKLSEGFVEFTPCVPHRDIPIEEFFTEAIMYDKIAKLKNGKK